MSVYPFAAEGLRFYSRVAAFQKDMYGEIQRSLGSSPKIAADRPLREELDFFLLLPRFSSFLAVVGQSAPAPLAKASTSLLQRGPAGWQRAIEVFWHSDDAMADSSGMNGGHGQAAIGDATDGDVAERLIPWMFLQPYAEFLADHRETLVLDGTPFTCPLCGAKPITGVLRSEGDGAKKSLICMLCAHEWAFRRIYCPACGEEREPQMAFYSAPEIPHVRVDVCDTCHTYLKSIDLTKTGLAVPVVDELATIPPDLWAREHGYEKLQINVIGI